MKEKSINAGNSMAQKTTELKTSVARSETYKKLSAGTNQTVSQIGQGAATLKEKVKSQQFAKNLMGMFGQKKMVDEPGRANDYVEEQKEEEDPQSHNPTESQAPAENNDQK